MNELRSIKTYSDLSALSLNDQTRFRLNEFTSSLKLEKEKQSLKN